MKQGNSCFIKPQRVDAKVRGALSRQGKEVPWLENLFKKLWRSDFSRDLFISSQKRTCFSIDEGSGYFLSGSFFHRTANFLYFHGKHPFFIVQCRNSVDGIYFPWLSLYYGILNTAVLSIVDTFSKGLDESVLKKFNRPAFFSGFVASQPQPYHFFYDVMPAANNILSDKNLTKEKFNVYSKQGCAFLDLSNLYPVVDKHSFFSTNKKGWFSPGEGSYYISLLPNRYMGKDVLNDDLDSFLRKELRLSFDDTIQGLGVKKLWIGVMAGKRTITNQLELILAACKEFKAQFPNCFFVFDGMTKPLGQQEDVLLGIEHDEIINQAVDALCIAKDEYIVLNKCEAEEKIKIAQACDFYISESNTQSMYPSRFAGLPGLAYSLSCGEHRHPKTTFFPKYGLYSNEQDVTGADWQFSDFSIDIEVFLEYFRKAIRENFGNE